MNKKWNHDCDSCEFLRTLGRFNLYFCPMEHGGSIVARYGDDLSSYISMDMESVFSCDLEHEHTSVLQTGLLDVLKKKFKEPDKREWAHILLDGMMDIQQINELADPSLSYSEREDLEKEYQERKELWEWFLDAEYPMFVLHAHKLSKDLSSYFVETKKKYFVEIEGRTMKLILWDLTDPDR